MAMEAGHVKVTFDIGKIKKVLRNSQWMMGIFMFCCVLSIGIATKFFSVPFKLSMLNIIIFYLGVVGFMLLNDYLNEFRTPFLFEFAKKNFCAKLESVLGYSDTAKRSMLTGTYPEENGIWSEFVFRKKLSYVF